MLQKTKNGIIIPIKVIPKSQKNEVIGWENDELKIKIAAVPEKGNANDALVSFLAKYLKISKSCITLHSGEKSRHKRICIQGLTPDQLNCFFPLPDG